jgi:hypothetical protein
LFITPRNQVVPLRRATATYSLMDAATVVLSSQLVGTESNQARPGHLEVVA